MGAMDVPATSQIEGPDTARAKMSPRNPKRLGSVYVEEFLVVLQVDHAQGGLGLTIDSLDERGLVVANVNGGAASAWNEGEEDDFKHICVNDIILSADGINCNALQLQRYLETETTLRLILKRPLEFGVSVKRVPG